MERTRTTKDKAAIAIAAAASAWVVGATLFFASGDINPAGILPTVACLLALGAAIQRDKTWMWVGTVLALFFSVAFVFSVGLVVAPAALGLMTGSILLSREISDDSRSTQPGRIRGRRFRTRAILSSVCR